MKKYIMYLSRQKIYDAIYPSIVMIRIVFFQMSGAYFENTATTLTNTLRLEFSNQECNVLFDLSSWSGGIRGWLDDESY